MAFRFGTLPALLTALIGGSAFAQVATDEAANPAAPASYADLESLIGATVHLEPSADERREAAEEGERPDRPKGEVDDLLLDTESGKLSWAVISFGGFLGVGDRTVAVPCSALRWNSAQEAFRLDATEEQLKALPQYDLDAARERGLDHSIDVVETSWVSVRKLDAKDDAAEKEAKEAAAQREKRERGEPDRPITITGKAYAFYPHRLVTASKLDDYEVHGRDGKFGSISQVLVDCSKQKVDLVVVDRGGVANLGETSYLVPYAALQLCQCTEEADDLAFFIDRPVSELEHSVRYEKPDRGVVDPAAARDALDRLRGEQKR